MKTSDLREALKRKIDEANDYKLVKIQNVLNEVEAEEYKLKKQEKSELPEIVQQLIDQGIKELDQGKGIQHEEVMRRMKEKYPSLK